MKYAEVHVNVLKTYKLIIKNRAFDKKALFNV